MKGHPKANIGIDGIQRGAEADRNISKVIAEVLSTESGKELLRYLRSITIEMVNGPNVSTEELRHLEGQRYIVGLLEQRIASAHRRKAK